MAGIKNIQEIYNKLGEDKFKELLAGNVRITEKFDTFRFAFEVNKDTGTLNFYNKNGKTPLNKIDRTISDLYEHAIEYISNLPKDNLKSLPSKHRFGFSWFPTNQPLNTKYERLPKNGLILTDVTLRKSDSDVATVIYNNNVLERFSKHFNCEWNKPIFEGYLSEDAINQLVDIAKEKTEQINEFLFPIKGLLNEKRQNIEAIVFNINDIIFKLSNDEDIINIRENRSHLFDILLLEICEHINNTNTNTLKNLSSESDIAYIDIICELFNSFVDYKGLDFLDSNLDKPKFLEKSGKFNKKWITNKKTLKLIENKKYEYLLSVFLSNLKKPKYPSGLLSESVVNSFNTKIEEITKITKNNLSFLEFNYIKINEAEKKEEVKNSNSKPTKDVKHDKEEDSRIEKSIVLLESFFNNDKKFPKKEEVTVIMCNCSLLTNSLISQFENIFNKTKKRIILIHNKHEDFLHMEDSDVDKIVTRFIHNRNDIFIGHYIISLPLAQTIMQRCNNFVPSVLYCTDKNFELIKIEQDNLKALYGEAYSFSLEKISNKYYKEALEMVESNSEIEFQKITPEEIHPFWYTIKQLFDTAFYHS